MLYSNIVPGIFISRPNRFIANVKIDGRVIKAHVKNTGRCKELLIPGVTVYLQKHDDPARKTGYSLIAVQKGGMIVNIDSQAPNKVMLEALKDGLSLPFVKEKITLIKPEAVFGDSRLDFYLEAGEQKAFMEVKGVTLEEDGICMFPDAPTERGVKHIGELVKAAGEGYHAYIIFVIQMKGVRCFKPNDATHAEFGSALREAAGNGVIISAYDCIISPDEMKLDKPVHVCLNQTQATGQLSGGSDHDTKFQ